MMMLKTESDNTQGMKDKITLLHPLECHLHHHYHSYHIYHKHNKCHMDMTLEQVHRSRRNICYCRSFTNISNKQTIDRNTSESHICTYHSHCVKTLSRHHTFIYNNLVITYEMLVFNCWNILACLLYTKLGTNSVV